MSNNFLQVDKSLFGSGLSPIEMLVLSQIAEFNRTTGDCFMSNAAMAKNFGVSEKTIARTMDALESKGHIVRSTKNTQKGKERHITLAKDNLSLGNETSKSAKDKMTLPERTNCPLPKGQNDTIKDNIIKDNIKDNIGVDECSLRFAPANSSTLEPAQEEEGKTAGKPKEMKLEWFQQNYNHHEWQVYSHICGIYLHKPSGIYYKIKK